MKLTHLCSALLCASICVASARAQESSPGAADDSYIFVADGPDFRPGPEGSWRLSAGVQATAASELDKSGSDLSSADLSLSVTYARRLRPGHWLTLGVPLSRTSYEFSGGASSFDDVSTAGASVGYLGLLNRDWSCFSTATLRTSAEQGADYSDALSVALIAGARYRVSPALSLGLGIAATQQIEGDPFVIPIPVVTWHITDALTLKTQQGLKLELQLDEEHEHELGLNLGYERLRFRLSDDNAVREGVALHEKRVLGGSYTYRPAREGWYLRANLDFVAAQDVTLFDRDGREVASDETGRSTALGFSVGYSF